MARCKLFMVALGMACATSVLAENHTVRLHDFVAKLPTDTRWQNIPSKNNSQLTALLVDKGEWRAIMLMPVDLQQKIPNESVLMEVAKKLVAITGGDMARQRGLSLERERYSHVKHETNRCVKANTVHGSVNLAESSSVAEKLWATFLICSRPGFDGRLGYIVAHSYVRPREDKDLDGEAQTFIDNLKIVITR